MSMRIVLVMNFVEAAVGNDGWAMYSIVANSSLCPSLYGF